MAGRLPRLHEIRSKKHAVAAKAPAPRPSLTIPHLYDQHYWAGRVRQLGIGVQGLAPENLAVEAVISALRECMHPDVAARASQLSECVERFGARAAAHRLIDEFG